ncbi:DUF3800 domain-containing protein [Selenomonas ruminantium]|uniref:DUF3800 domain-containing protein n=1 Tax=Selenomonas ruminantium TaxID=971 RepID=A0A1K1N650_SELRU|nr:DUF3800 domain-containing protein [Selenomonas ruminantium]SFW30828.1 hypothetical protein SAMN02910323_1202 [Selenomonas ruminantium]
MQEVYFFFDDSGVFHKSNQVGIFVYAGYVFESRADVDNAKRKYRAMVKNLKKSLGRDDELKAFGLSAAHKRALYNVLRQEESLSIVVKLNNVYDSILASSKSICRYKDYVMKMAVKRKLSELIDKQILLAEQDITLHISIDEQLTSTDGIYGLSETIKQELQYGIFNHDYGVFHKPLFTANVNVQVRYCESKCNYMIQASDILANRIFTSYRNSKPELRQIPNHTNLTFP